ncbi:MAG: adenylyl-sulfate kinase [Myxococcota bacterium]|nr:adenylyl-sulfate kinase [Myxococcota bacterium]
MPDRKSTNITWHEGTVSRSERERRLGQRGVTIWLTGLSGSGKSTIAVAAEGVLHARGRQAYVLDGDNVRHGLNANLGFSPDDRTENIRRIGEVAKLFTDSGTITLTSFISPYRADRDAVRAIMEPGDFVEVLVDASVETCEGRDVKGLYKKARAGEIPEFTGISAPYEAPEKPELVLDTNAQSVEESVAALIGFLEEKGYLGVR